MPEDEQEPTFEELLEQLKDEDFRKRRRAIFLLGHSDSKRALTAMYSVLDDKSEHLLVRRQVIDSFVPKNEEKIVQKLRIILEEEQGELKEYFLNMLLQMEEERKAEEEYDKWFKNFKTKPVLSRKDKRCFNELVEALNNERWITRREAVEDFRKLKEKNVLERLIELVQDKDKPSVVRAYATLALGTQRDENALNTLFQLLSDEDVRVRRFAPLALIDFKSKEAIELLIETLSDSDPYVVFISAYALSRLAEKEQVDKHLEKVEDNIMTSFITKGMVGDGYFDYMVDEILWYSLTAFWETEDKVYRTFEVEPKPDQEIIRLILDIVIYLSEWCDIDFFWLEFFPGIGESAVESLIEALKDDYAVKRKLAIGSLGNIGGEKALSALVEVLHDDDSYVRALAWNNLYHRNGLKYITKPKDIKQIIKIINEGVWGERFDLEEDIEYLLEDLEKSLEES